MSRDSRREFSPLRQAPLLILGAACATSGCVGIEEYRAAKNEVASLKLRLQAEHNQAQELDTRLRQLGEQVRDSHRLVQEAREEAARREREYKSIRDELLAIKIPIEQQRVLAQRRTREPTADQEALIVSSPEITRHPTAAAFTEEDKIHLKRALDDLQRLLATCEVPPAP